MFFFFNDTATTEIYTLSLHDALPISPAARTSLIISNTSAVISGSSAEVGSSNNKRRGLIEMARAMATRCRCPPDRSEEHTSELQSQSNLVCRLLLEKKKTL